MYNMNQTILIVFHLVIQCGADFVKASQVAPNGKVMMFISQTQCTTVYRLLPL